METYPCVLSPIKSCRHGGNKRYNYGFCSGTAGYCRLIKQWLCDIQRCPMDKKLIRPTTLAKGE
jgi:hypothetical protein